MKKTTCREESEISEEKHTPDLNFSGISRCGKGIYELQNSILRNPIMAETAQKRKKVFQVLRVTFVPLLLCHRGKTQVCIKGRAVCGVLGPFSCAKCTKPLQDTAQMTWVTQQVQLVSCWLLELLPPHQRGKGRGWCRAQQGSQHLCALNYSKRTMHTKSDELNAQRTGSTCFTSPHSRPLISCWW